jgi:hypothetical protein
MEMEMETEVAVEMAATATMNNENGLKNDENGGNDTESSR